MAIEKRGGREALVSALGSSEWNRVLDAVAAADKWLRAALPGDPDIDAVVSKLVLLANHSKWEVRRSVANIAAHVPHARFDESLAKLRTDDNSRVRQAAEHASLRRRDWQSASALGKQHEDRIVATMDDIGARFGARGRDAVKRASEEIANTFARELYHEIIKLVAPLALSADRLRSQLLDENASRRELSHAAERIERQVRRLSEVLDGMKTFAAVPDLKFTSEAVKDVIEEAAALVRDGGGANHRAPSIVIQMDAGLSGVVSRPRLVQAFRNLLANAVESYVGVEIVQPIVVRGEPQEGRIAIVIEDSGCGMSEEVLADAGTLFSTSKANGTGFGLPLAIKIIESEHGGRLLLDSTKGKGTVVRVLLPTHRQTEGR